MIAALKNLSAQGGSDTHLRLGKQSSTLEVVSEDTRTKIADFFHSSWLRPSDVEKRNKETLLELKKELLEKDGYIGQVAWQSSGLENKIQAGESLTLKDATQLRDHLVKLEKNQEAGKYKALVKVADERRQLFDLLSKECGNEKLVKEAIDFSWKVVDVDSKEKRGKELTPDECLSLEISARHVLSELLKTGRLPKSAFNPGNGHLPDNLSISDVMFLGAHNSSISKEDHFRYYQQNVDVESQFKDYGVRFFKTPLHYFSPDNTVTGKIKKAFTHEDHKPYIAIGHEPDGSSNCQITRLQREYNSDPDPAVDYFKKISKLIDDNPNEVVIVNIESYLSKKSESNGMASNPTPQSELLDNILKESGLKDQIFRLDNVSGRKLPTLGELRQAGKRVIFISDDYKDNVDNVSLYRESAYSLPKDEMTDAEKCRMRGEGRYGTKDFFVMNHFTEVALHENSFIGGVVNHLVPDSLAIKKKIEPVNYDTVNSYKNVKSRVEGFKKNLGLSANVIMMDFVDEGARGGVERVVAEANAKKARQG